MILKFYFKFKQWKLNKHLLKFEPKMIYHYNHLGEEVNHTRISNSTVINEKKNLILGENVFIGHFNFIEASNGIRIDEGVQITNYVSIISHSSHISIRLYGKAYQKFSDLKGYVKGNISIGKYTFIGPHSTILPSTQIGKGCIIKSYSQLKGIYPDFSIISGNPAIVVGDSRDIDYPYLEEYSELKEFYSQWVEE